MAVVDKIISLISGGLVKQIGDVVDKFVTTTEEKEMVKKEITEIMLQAEANAQDELTERQRIDMNSDSWLSKNIRPMVLIFILLTYSFFSVIDGNLWFEFNINEAYVELLGQWGMLIMSFYFGSRGIEKIIETMGRYGMNKKQRNNQ